MDREVWSEFGEDRAATKRIANLIRSGIQVAEKIKEEPGEYEVFSEGRVVTEAHLRRERDPKLRKRLLEQKSKSGALTCEMCRKESSALSPAMAEAMFEPHHIVPLSESNERSTRLADLALLCANCHRMVHKAIVQQKRWLSIEEARALVFGERHA